MARDAAEPTGSMGNDLALAMLSDKAPPLFDYFKQLFAQVTNPPIDPIRESIVMSLTSGLGAEQNLLAESPEHAHQLHLSQPVSRAATLERLRQVDHSVFWAHTVDITFPTSEGPDGLETALERISQEAEEVVEDGVTVLILSDRKVGPGRADRRPPSGRHGFGRTGRRGGGIPIGARRRSSRRRLERSAGQPISPGSPLGSS